MAPSEGPNARDDSMEGPAPPLEHKRGDPLTFRVTDGKREYDAAFQFWNGHAPYLAWQIGAERGTRATFDYDRKRVWLGPTGFPGGDGTYRYYVDMTTNVAEELEREYHRRLSAAQSPSFGAERVTGDEMDDVEPAPLDSAAAGEVFTFELTGWKYLGGTAFVQPWRPLNAGVVYLSCAYFNESSAEGSGLFDEYSVFEGRSAYLERGIWTFTVSFLHFAGTDAETIREEIETTRESLPDQGFSVLPE